MSSPDSEVSLLGLWVWRGDAEETARPPLERSNAHSSQTSGVHSEVVGNSLGKLIFEFSIYTGNWTPLKIEPPVNR